MTVFDALHPFDQPLQIQHKDLNTIQLDSTHFN